MTPPRPPSPPGAVQQLDLGEPLADHGGEEESEEHAADQHVVVVVLQHVELLGGVDARLVDVQSVGHHLPPRNTQHTHTHTHVGNRACMTECIVRFVVADALPFEYSRQL